MDLNYNHINYVQILVIRIMELLLYLSLHYKHSRFKLLVIHLNLNYSVNSAWTETKGLVLVSTTLVVTNARDGKFRGKPHGVSVCLFTEVQARYFQCNIKFKCFLRGWSCYITKNTKANFFQFFYFLLPINNFSTDFFMQSIKIKIIRISSFFKLIRFAW